MARGVAITLDKERTLRYDLNAIALIGEKLGLTLRLDHIKDDLLSAKLPLSMMRTVVWAGLRHEDATLTEEQVGAMVDAENLPTVMQAFFGLFGSNSPLARGPRSTPSGPSSPKPTPSAGTDSKT